MGTYVSLERQISLKQELITLNEKVTNTLSKIGDFPNRYTISFNNYVFNEKYTTDNMLLDWFFDKQRDGWVSLCIDEIEELVTEYEEEELNEEEMNTLTTLKDIIHSDSIIQDEIGYCDIYYILSIA